MSHASHPAAAALDIGRDLARRLGEVVDREAFAVILYGSCARGTGDAESDVDLLVCFEGDDSAGVVQDAALRIACDLTLAHGVLVSVLVADRAFRDRRRGFSFLEAVEQDGVRV